MNQYAPPVAEVADRWISDEKPVMKLFSAQGRIGRLRYLAYTTGATLLFYLVLGVAALLGEVATGILALLAFVPALWFGIVSAVKRCHDCGYSGWMSLTVLIPLIGLIWFVLPGDKAANRFGPPPPPNTWGVRLLGLLLPLIFLIGILAAVAIPAYQGYVTKARAAQADSPQR
jgi:uncharacterized membrane protein YhaH (DUF805 family)